MKKINISKNEKVKKLIILCIILFSFSIITVFLNHYEQKSEEIRNSNEIVLKVDSSSVETISWEYNDEKFSFYKEDENWIYDNDNTFPVDSSKIESILSNFEEFGVSFIIENVEDYNQYGLDNPECIIKIKTSDKEYQILVGDFSKMDEQRYVDIGDGNVYLVSKDPTDYLSTDLKNIILNDKIDDIENVTKIKFSGDYNYEINYEENSKNSYSKDDVYFTKKNSEVIPLDTSKVNSYIDTITSLDLSEYVTYNVSEKLLKEYNLDDPKLSITLDYNYVDENKKTQTGAVTIHIGYNQSEWKKTQKAEEKNSDDIPSVTKYIRIGDSKIIYKIDDTTYDELIESSQNSLRHSKVVWMNMNDVTKIDVTLEGNTHTFTSKENKNETVWYYNKNKISIDSFESTLKNLNVSSFTSAQASDKEEISLSIYLNNDNFSKIDLKVYRYDGKKCLVVLNGESYAYITRSNVTDLIESVQAIVLD